MYYITTKNNTDYLVHHGILGQKWGVRRYQNEDGSLTNAGRKRYGKEVYKIIKKHGVSGMNVDKELSNSRITKDIINDPEYVKSKNAYKNAIKYETMADNYDPFEDKEALSAMVKAYKKDFGREPDLDSKDYWDVSRYVETIKPTKAMKEAQQAETIATKAYNDYKNSLKNTVNKYLGSIGDKKVRDTLNVLGENKTLSRAVEHIIHNREISDLYSKFNS